MTTSFAAKYDAECREDKERELQTDLSVRDRAMIAAAITVAIENIQREIIFEQDSERLSPTELHERLMMGSIFWRQMERIAAALPGANRLVAC